jgi:hypothetical protein
MYKLLTFAQFQGIARQRLGLFDFQTMDAQCGDARDSVSRGGESGLFL